MKNVANEINSLKLRKGMRDLEANLTEEDDGFVYSGGRLSLARPSFYGDFGKEFNSLYDENNHEMENILKDVYYPGGRCGSGPKPPFRLIKELCTEYNLTCGAW